MKCEDIYNLIKNNIYLYGQACSITRKSGEVINTYAVTRRLWKTNKTRLQPTATMIGMSEKNYMIAIFASNVPVEDCSEEDTIVFENKKFYFVRVDKMMAGGYLQYYSAVLREVESEEEDVFG